LLQSNKNDLERAVGVPILSVMLRRNINEEEQLIGTVPSSFLLELPHGTDR
jgi:hypothetical protein